MVHDTMNTIGKRIATASASSLNGGVYGTTAKENFSCSLSAKVQFDMQPFDSSKQFNKNGRF